VIPLVSACLPLRLLPVRLRAAPVVCSSSFSFHAAAAPRALHSFPTRRSSDLSQCPDCRLSDSGKCLRKEIIQCFSLFQTPLELLDRKSTRLNSSHVSISYAVFCLKKKRESNDYSQDALQQMHTAHSSAVTSFG